MQYIVIIGYLIIYHNKNMCFYEKIKNNDIKTL